MGNHTDSSVRRQNGGRLAAFFVCHRVRRTRPSKSRSAPSVWRRFSCAIGSDSRHQQYAVKDCVCRHRTLDPCCCQQRPSRPSRGRDESAEREGGSQERRCQQSQNRQRRPGHQGRFAGECLASRQGADRRGQSARNGNRQRDNRECGPEPAASPQEAEHQAGGEDAAKPKTARKSIASPNAYIPADASASGPCVLSSRISSAAPAASAAAT